MKSPVLFIVFNRPDTTYNVFETIKTAKPKYLYVAADGPRKNKEGEIEICNIVRDIATAVDWQCIVKTLFQDENLGCKIGVSTAINWFFEHEEEGIILEDDCLPVDSFYIYCDELLERYRNDNRIGLISGCNLISKRIIPNESYFFSKNINIWGWASWRRAWRLYDINMHSWPEWRDGKSLKNISDGNMFFVEHWRNMLNNTYNNNIDTWDYQWTYSCWKNEMLCILPLINQIKNIGFLENAVHTTYETPNYVNESVPEILTFPLLHPKRILRNIQADILIDKRVVGLTTINYVRGLTTINYVRRYIKLFRKLHQFIHYVVNKIEK